MDTLSPVSPSEQLPSQNPDTTPSPPQDPNVMQNRTGDIPNYIGPLLAETVTTVDWKEVKSVVPRRTMVSLGAAAMRHRTLMPAFAESVAYRLSPVAQPAVETPRITPEDVKQARPTLGLASRAIGWFSPKLANRFDGYIAEKAQERVDVKAAQVTGFIETLGAVEAPRAEFVAEIGRIYDLLQNDKYGREPEEILAGLLWDAGDAWKNKPKYSYGLWLQLNCPVISDALSAFMTPALGAKLKHPRLIRAITPEIVSGIQAFLQNETQQPVEPIQTSPQVSIVRQISMRRKKTRERIARLPDRVSEALTQVRTILPEDGPKFKREITQVANNAVMVNDPLALMRDLLKLYEQEEDDEKVHKGKRI